MPKHNFKAWVWAAAVAVVLAIVGYPFYFNWWDHKNCQESGGTWNEAQGECVEPRGAKFDTEESLHSGGDKPRE